MKNIKYKVLGLAMMVALVSSCDEQEVASVPSLDLKPRVTITRIDDNAGDNSVNEGDILEFEVKTDKFMKVGIDFSTLFGEATNLVEGQDYEILSGATIAPYSETSLVSIQILDDGFPEINETLALQIIPEDIAQNWQLHPDDLTGKTFNLQVKNVNAEGAISVGFMWADDHDDFDMYVFSEDADDVWGDNIYEGATGNDPEVSTVIKNADPDGTYFVSVDPYAVEHDVTEYTVSVGKDDGSSQVFTGTFDLNNLDGLETDAGGYRLVKIVKDGANITVTHLNE
jgi:hypothetical protein